MNERKRPIKLFTWKQGIAMGTAVVLGIALFMYCNYQRKGYLDRNDLIIAISTVMFATATFLGVTYYANRSKKGK